jgi:hypothetical protein
VGAGFEPAPHSDVRTRDPDRLLICPTESLVDKYVFHYTSHTKQFFTSYIFGGSTQHLIRRPTLRVRHVQYIGDSTQYLVRRRTPSISHSNTLATVRKIPFATPAPQRIFLSNNK